MKIPIYLTVLGLLVSGLHSTISAQTNLQQYTPSVLLKKGQWEIKHFTNIYTQTKAFDDQLRKDDQLVGGRQTYVTDINQFTYGIGPKYSVGLDVWIKYVSVSDSQGQRQRIGVTGIGPRIKSSPFKQLPRLALQSTFLFPISSDTESRETDAEYPGLFLEFDRYLWISEAFYDIPLSRKSQLFVRGAWWTSFPRNSFRTQPFFETPVTVFFNYFPSERLTTYAVLEYWGKHVEDFQNENGRADSRIKLFNSFFSQAGLGLKYQLIPGWLEGELLYTTFWLGSPGEGAGQTFNFGLRFIR